MTMPPSDLPSTATTPSPSPLLSLSTSLLFTLPLKASSSDADTDGDSSLVGSPPVSDSPSSSSSSSALFSSAANGSNSTIILPPSNSSSPVLSPSLKAPLPSPPKPNLPSPPTPNPQQRRYHPESLLLSPSSQPRLPTSPRPVSSPPPAPSSPPLPNYPPPPAPKRSSLSPLPLAPSPFVSPPIGLNSFSLPPPHALLKSPPPPPVEQASPPSHSSPPAVNSTTSPNSASLSVSSSRNRTDFAPSSVTLIPPPHHSSTKSPSSSSSSTTPSTESTSSSVQTIMVVGATFAGVVILALVATVFVLSRKKNKRAEVYPQMYAPPPNFTVQSDGYYYGPSSTVGVSGQSESFYPSQVPYSGSSLGSQRGKGNHGGGPESELLTGTKNFYSYEEVMEMTGGFAHQNIIGEGGFGSVYKGQLPDGRVVAVKQLKDGSGQGDREFRAEVEIISRVHHRHLVSLVGYCIHDNQRLLIYEFLSNKTLDYHLHGKDLPVLEWTKRVQIALGAAKGLAYLHEDCHPKIIHRDIKSSNILLDDAFESQVSDFGLAKLTNDTSTHVSTRVMGTFGYLAPEYASSGKLTDRSDVFSFGVMLLELITGRKPVDPTQPLGDESLVEWSRPLLIRALEMGDVSEVVDPRLQKHYVESEMLRMIEAAAACIRHSATKRPRMAQVVRALDSDAEKSDLTNGVKYGQSTIYDSGQYSEDIMKFRRMAHGSNDSLDLGLSSREHTSSGVPSAMWKSKDSSSDFTSSESETRAFTGTSRRAC